MQRLSRTEGTGREERVKDSIMESLKLFFQELHRAHGGRWTNEAMTLSHAVALALYFQCQMVSSLCMRRTRTPIFFWGERGDSYMGDMQPDDQVLLVRKFETEKPGLNTFALTTKVFPVFIEDVRWNLTVRNTKDKQLGDLNEIEGPRRSVRTSSAGTTPEAEVLGHIKATSRYRLSSDCKASLLFHSCSAGVIEDEDEGE